VVQHIESYILTWTTVALFHCCNLIWGLANNNYSLKLLSSVFDWLSIYVCAIFYFPSYYSWNVKQIGRDTFLLLKITQIWVITICVVLDHSTVIFHIKNHWYARLQIVMVDRNKNLTLNRCPLGNYEFKKIEQIRSDNFLTIY
jgi:hypothetical protein